MTDSKSVTEASAASEHVVSSAEWAADPTLIQIWDRTVPFPSAQAMWDVDVVTHVHVDRAVAADGTIKYRYLHDSRLTMHRGVLHLGWANHMEGEKHYVDAVIRGCRSTDGGMTWSEPRPWAHAPMCGAEAFNHSVLSSHQGRLWGFFTCWNDRVPRAEIFTYDEGSEQWQPCNTPGSPGSPGSRIPGLVPFHPPMRMADGNWIIGGEETFYRPAVAISAGDDFTQWRLVPIPHPAEMKLEFPETALLDQGDRILAICRPKGQFTALVSESRDMGQTWTPLAPSNFPMASSQPCAGKLSTGAHYLITNHLEEGRTLLTIAVTAPGARTFSRIWKIRHQANPLRRVFTGVFWRDKLVKPMLGTPTEWSYPSAVEHDGQLIVSHTQGKEGCVVSIIPIRVLATE